MKSLIETSLKHGKDMLEGGKISDYHHQHRDVTEMHVVFPIFRRIHAWLRMQRSRAIHIPVETESAMKFLGSDFNLGTDP